MLYLLVGIPSRSNRAMRYRSESFTMSITLSPPSSEPGKMKVDTEKGLLSFFVILEKKGSEADGEERNATSQMEQRRKA